MSRKASIFASACACMPLMFAAAPAMGQEATNAQAQPDDGGDIVVTAERRETSLRDTPAAITAISPGTLAKTGGEDLADLAAVAPSLYFSQNFGITQIFIRGVGNNFFAPGGDAGVALYADVVYLSDQEATTVAFLDLQRIEVLRGPQGALYGRNATGGAVNLISARPEAEFGGRLAARVGDFGRREADGFLTGSVGDLRARASFQYRRLDGFARNELAGTPGAPDRLDAENSFAGRLQLELPTASGGSLRLIANGFTQDDNGPALKILPDSTPQPAELLFGVRPSAARRALKSEFAQNRRDTWSVTSVLKQPIGGATLNVIADYRENDRRIGYDQDGTERDVSRTVLDTTSDQRSIEAYLTGESSSFNWLIGANYIDFRQTRITSVDTLIPAAFLDPTLPATVPIPVQFEGGGTLRSRAWAAYADGSYALTSTLRARLGIRYSRDRKRADEVLQFFGLRTGRTQKSWGEWTGKASLDWKPAENTLVYGSVSRGFKAGALNVGAFTPAVDPEIIINYEIGAKAQLLDKSLDLSLAAFISDYRDLQIVQVGPISQILANAADSSIRGVELEATLRPAPGLSLSAIGSYLDAKFNQFSSTDQRRGFATFDLRGNQLPLVSRWQAGLTASYEARLDDGSVLSLNGAVQARSKYFFTEFNTRDARQSGFARIDLGAFWTLPGNRLSVSAFVRNVTGIRVIGSLSIVSPLLGSVRVASLEPPRYFGFGLNYLF